MYTCYDGVYDQYGASRCMPTFSAAMADYWERSLFQRMRTLFRIEGLPEGWDKDAFLYGLYRCGYLCGFISRRYGRVFQPAMPAGYGINFQPTRMVISTPFFQFNRGLRIGEECEVIKLTPDYRGVWDIVTKYASELEQAEVAIRQSQINARFAYAITAENDKEAQTAKMLLEKLANGEPGVVYNTKYRKKYGDDSSESQVPWQQFDRDLKQNFILPELLESRRTILSDFYREMGVRIAPDKRERLVEKEAQSYDAETFVRREVWNISLQESLRRFNAFMDTRITAEYVEPDEGGEDRGIMAQFVKQ